MARNSSTACCMASRLRRNSSPWTSRLDSITAMSVVLEQVRGHRPMETIERLAVVVIRQREDSDIALTGCTIDAQGVATDKGGSIGKQEDDGAGHLQIGRAH